MKAYKLLHGAKIPENYILFVKYVCEADFLHFYILEFCNYSFMSICKVLGMACNHLVVKDQL